MARRRANGEGSIRKRSDGSWEGRITIGYDPFGKQVMKSVYGRTQRDVKEKLERLKDDLEGKSSKQTEQADSDSSKDKKEITEKEVDNTGEGICMLTLEQWLDIWRKQYLSKALRCPENIQLLSIPPYTPEMNPIEQIWKQIRSMGFRNEVFDSLSAVMDRLCETICLLTTDMVKSNTGRQRIIECF